MPARSERARQHVVGDLLRRLDVHREQTSVTHPHATALVERKLGLANHVERAVHHPVDPDASSLLRRRTKENDVALQAVALGGELYECRHRRGEGALVVDRSAAMEETVSLGGLEWWRVPLGGIGADYIHVPHNENRAPGRIGSTQAGDEVRAAVADVENASFDSRNALEHRIEVRRDTHLVAGRILRVEPDERRKMRARIALTRSPVISGRRRRSNVECVLRQCAAGRGKQRQNGKYDGGSVHDIDGEGSECRRHLSGASPQDIALPRHGDTASSHEPLPAECVAGAARRPR